MALCDHVYVPAARWPRLSRAHRAARRRRAFSSGCWWRSPRARCARRRDPRLLAVDGGPLVAVYYNATLAVRSPRSSCFSLTTRSRHLWILAGCILARCRAEPRIGRALLAQPSPVAYAVWPCRALSLSCCRSSVPPLPARPGRAGRVKEIMRRRLHRRAGAARRLRRMNLLMAATPIAMQHCKHPSHMPRWCSSARAACSCRALHRPAGKRFGGAAVMAAGCF